MSNSRKKIQSVPVQCDKIKEERYSILPLSMNLFGEDLNILENTSSSGLSSDNITPTILESKDIFKTFILKSSISRHTTPNI